MVKTEQSQIKNKKNNKKVKIKKEKGKTIT
jgi:hypothetical protein